MNHWLILATVFCVVVSAFFSASETALMAINRYRLRHLARLKRHGAARRVKKLLERPDRLLSMLLIGNTCANIIGSAITTIIAHEIFGNVGVAIATFIFTFFILVFSEIAPKTVAAMHAERVAFLASWPLVVLSKIFYPVIVGGNFIVHSLLRVLGYKFDATVSDHLSIDELRTMLRDSAKLSSKHQKMLLGILDLERVSVDDIMIPRSEIIGIDLDSDWEKIQEQLAVCQHTRLPVYHTDINRIVGVLHVRDALHAALQETLNQEKILAIIRPALFVLEATSLIQQLMNFQHEYERTGIVVDEYGDVLGLITIEDILEEVVGEFTTDLSQMNPDIHPQEDDSYLVEGSIAIRKLNHLTGSHFPTSGAKTLNGVIIEYLETIPVAGSCLKINNYPIEIIQVKDNMIKTARVFRRL
jgi:Mg2+/Co2+ transporter CorB